MILYCDAMIICREAMILCRDVMIEHRDIKLIPQNYCRQGTHATTKLGAEPQFS